MDIQLTNSISLFLFPLIARQMHSSKLHQPQMRFGLPCVAAVTWGLRHSGALALLVPRQPRPF